MKEFTLKNCHRALILVSCTGIIATSLAGFNTIKTSAEVGNIK